MQQTQKYTTGSFSLRILLTPAETYGYYKYLSKLWPLWMKIKVIATMTTTHSLLYMTEICYVTTFCPLFNVAFTLFQKSESQSSHCSPIDPRGRVPVPPACRKQQLSTPVIAKSRQTVARTGGKRKKEQWQAAVTAAQVRLTPHALTPSTARAAGEQHLGTLWGWRGDEHGRWSARLLGAVAGQAAS